MCCPPRWCAAAGRWCLSSRPFGRDTVGYVALRSWSRVCFALLVEGVLCSWSRVCSALLVEGVLCSWSRVCFAFRALSCAIQRFSDHELESQLFAASYAMETQRRWPTVSYPVASYAMDTQRRWPTVSKRTPKKVLDWRILYVSRHNIDFELQVSAVSALAHAFHS